MAKPGKSSAARPPAGDLTLGANIRAARKRAELTQEALADMVGVTKGAISQYEKALNVPGLDVLRKLGEALGCGVDALLYGGSAQRFHQPALPGMSFDERVAALPEAMREFVLLSLMRAERAVRHIPSQFINTPTSDNWPQFAAYLEAITLVGQREEQHKK